MPQGRLTSILNQACSILIVQKALERFHQRFYLTAFTPIFLGPYILRPMSELGQICAQIEDLEVYFPMEQT